MYNNNFNGQNGVATSAVKFNVVVKGLVKGFDVLDDVVDDVVMMMKKYPSDAIYVNGKGIRFEKGLDGKWSVVLRDDEMKMIAGYVMGKIKRGLADAVAHVLGYVEENEVEENYDVFLVRNMEDLANDFNEVIKNKVEEDFKECLDELREFATKYDMKDKYFCIFNYDYDFDSSWVAFADGYGIGADDANEFYRENMEMFVNEDDLCELVYGFEETYGVGIDDNCCGDCVVWMKNPDDAPVKNDSPCLDDAIERVVDTIKTYVNNYEGLMMDYDGNSASICVGWDNFNEDDMKILIEDDIFSMSVRDTLYKRGTLKNLDGFLVYDDGVYVSVDYDKMFSKKEHSLGEIIENALESAMDDGKEYYDDKICKIGDLYVSYTSPCDEFPDGCVCVVNEKECWIGGEWCSVKDSGFAVDFLVETIEKFNRVA